MGTYLEDLNAPQLEAVTHGDGPLLVLAGAGSGKTRALTHRIAYLIKERGVPPWHILAITFTNKAAGEMRERVAALVPELSGDIWVATFHSTCARILRREASLAGRRPDFAIFDTADQRAVVRRILSVLRWEQKKFPPAAFLAAISTAKNEMLGAEEFAARSGGQRGDFWAQRTARVFRAYEEELERNNALDFDDLLVRTVNLFESHPDVLARYQDRFRYILVDEYQDTNHAQYRLVRALAAGHRNLCVVGDDDQSIYAFRGADPRNILEFERDYPEAVVVKLEQNYRSTTTVLEAANSLVRHNDRRKHKHLWTENGIGEPIGFYQAESQKDEAAFVCRTLAALMRETGELLRRAAVLYRTNAQSRPLEEVLNAAGIPYQLVGGVRFYERKEIKDVIAYLRLVANPADTISLERVINVPRRGVGPVTWERVLKASAEEGVPVAEMLCRAGALSGVAGKTRDELVRLGELLAELRQELKHLRPQDFVRAVCQRAGYTEALRAERTGEAEDRLENLDELHRLAAEYHRATGEAGLAGFLEQVALMGDIDEYDEGKDRLTLMTVHSAKGLEFDTVFLVGLDEGVFPHVRSLGEAGALEEERRLCYVAITRARRRLLLSCVGRRMTYDGQPELMAPSRFLRELPPGLLRVIARPADWLGGGGDPARPVTVAAGAGGGWGAGVGLKPAFTHRSAGAAQPGAVPKPGGPSKLDAAPKPIAAWALRVAGDGDTYSEGERVRHPKFGEGTIVRILGTGQDAELTVAFPGLGLKRLLAGYARLEKVSADGGDG
ncbi:MAG: UvrD-helicase domain-containing protein [Bacillota bacterium]|nr:UvrD-helicase domain-containing protein [Bacillota bacterium]